MPHLIIEHSSDIQCPFISSLYRDIQEIMLSIKEGDFDPDQCKARVCSFDKYLVGNHSRSTSSFFHISIKILSGRSIEIRKKLAQKTLESAKSFLSKQNLSYKRCDISVDIIEMDREAYQKIQIEHL